MKKLSLNELIEDFDKFIVDFIESPLKEGLSNAEQEDKLILLDCVKSLFSNKASVFSMLKTDSPLSIRFRTYLKTKYKESVLIEHAFDKNCFALLDYDNYSS